MTDTANPTRPGIAGTSPRFTAHIRRQRGLVGSLAGLVLAACGGHAPVSDTSDDDLTQGGDFPDAVPKVEPRGRLGNPPFYIVAGKRYDVLVSNEGFVERGVASWYGPQFHGRRTSSGETYDMYAMSAAHPSLPLPTYVRVTNLENGRQAILRINDRGPFHDSRVIDLSYAAARKLGVLQRGTAMVEVRALSTGNSEATPPVPSTQLTVATMPSLYVQVGAFSERDNAEQLRAQLLLHELAEVHIQHGDDAVYRVRIGPLTSVNDADATTQRLEALGVSDSRLVVE